MSSMKRLYILEALLAKKYEEQIERFICEERLSNAPINVRVLRYIEFVESLDKKFLASRAIIRGEYQTPNFIMSRSRIIVECELMGKK